MWRLNDASGFIYIGPYDLFYKTRARTNKFFVEKVINLYKDLRSAWIPMFKSNLTRTKSE